MSAAVPRSAPDGPPVASATPTIPTVSPISVAAAAVAAPAGPGAPRHRRLPAGRGAPSIWLTLLAAAGVVLLWVAVVWLSPQLQVASGLRELVRFGHLAALVLGFGAALTVEWFGLLWVLGRRPLSVVTQVAQGAHLPIWLGLAGLTASGMLLSPAQPTVAGTIKLGAVLLVALNGVYAVRLQHQLTCAGAAPRRPLLVRAAIAGGISQLGWWCAVVIGFLATRG